MSIHITNMHDDRPERTERVIVSVTPREKRALRFLAVQHDTDVSTMIRERAFATLLEEAAGVLESFEAATAR